GFVSRTNLVEERRPLARFALKGRVKVLLDLLPTFRLHKSSDQWRVASNRRSAVHHINRFGSSPVFASSLVTVFESSRNSQTLASAWAPKRVSRKPSRTSPVSCTLSPQKNRIPPPRLSR